MARARAKRIRTKGAAHEHPTGEIVLSAIKKLMKNTGWTARTIVKFIKMEYSINDPTLNRKVSRALRQGVKLGVLHADRGRYRLGNMSVLARPVPSKIIKRVHGRRAHSPQRGIRFRSSSRERNRRSSSASTRKY